MVMTMHGTTARTFAVVIFAALGLAACATKEDIAGSTHVSTRSTRALRVRPRMRNPPIRMPNAPTNGSTKWKAASSSSRRNQRAARAARRAAHS